MMKHFQPQGHYTPLESDFKMYKKQLQTILITNFTIVSTKTKWKLGQNKPQNIREQVAQKLKQRALPNDLLSDCITKLKSMIILMVTIKLTFLP